MGMTCSAHCESCGLEGEDLFVGGGGRAEWSLVRNDVFFCPVCQKLESAETLRSRAELREVAESEWGRGTEIAIATVAELVASAGDPRCEAEHRMRHVRWSIERPARCPRCRKRTLKVEATGLWD